MFQWPDLSNVLAGIRWAIVGAVAARRYMPERATRDLDIAVLTTDLAAVEERLQSVGYLREGNLSIGGSSWRTTDGTPIDVVEAKESWWTKALDEAAGNLDENGSPVLTAPYLILMKLLAARLQDLADVSRILGEADDELVDQVRAVIRENAAYMTDDLESLVVLGRLEHGED